MLSSAFSASNNFVLFYIIFEEDYSLQDWNHIFFIRESQHTNGSDKYLQMFRSNQNISYVLVNWYESPLFHLHPNSHMTFFLLRIYIYIFFFFCFTLLTYDMHVIYITKLKLITKPYNEINQYLIISLQWTKL